MSSLKDFLSKSLSTELANRVGNVLSAKLVAAGAVASFDRYQDDFVNEVKNLSCSDEVITELSERVGEPKENESEDEFVSRAKSTLENILRRKMLE